MQIIFKKRTNKNHIITYKRPSTSDFWMEADEFLVLHDLSHYAIETTLGYKDAFWGLTRSGIDPTVFLDKEKRDKLFIKDEAWYAECLANLFLMELTQGEFEDINAVIADSLKQTNPGIRIPVFGKEEIEKIRSTYKKLVAKWKGLKNDEEMILAF